MTLNSTKIKLTGAQVIQLLRLSVERGTILNAIDLAAEWVRAAEARVKELLEPHFYWDNRHTDCSYESIEDATEDDEPGAIVELRPIHELPTIFVLVREDGYEEFASREEAEREAENIA